MSIPLDNLYHYLEGLISDDIRDDIIIYRWSPHGSKKLEDLTPTKEIIYNINSESGWLNSMLKIHMICHDQEPLNYNYYTPKIGAKELSRRQSKKLSEPWKLTPSTYKKFSKLVAKSQFRIATYPIIGLRDNLLLCHSEKNSENLKLYEQNGFIGVYYWAHALIARDWYRYAEYDDRLTTNFDRIKFDFLMYGRGWSGSREYRLKMFELLTENNLISNCNTRFNPTDSGVDYKNHIFINQSLTTTRTDIENFFPTNLASSNSSADYSVDDYLTSGIEVVLETLFDDSRQHLTEKILRPIACGRPFILAGTPGSLEYLRSYGFKTFSGIINESYDTIADPLLRLQAIVAELKRLSNLNHKEKIACWQQLYEISKYNQTRFFSQEFHNDIVNEYQTNIKIGIEKCIQTTTGKWWKLCGDPDMDVSKHLYPPVTKNRTYLSFRSKTANEWLEKNSSQRFDLSITPSQSSPGSEST